MIEEDPDEAEEIIGAGWKNMVEEISWRQNLSSDVPILYSQHVKSLLLRIIHTIPNLVKVKLNFHHQNLSPASPPSLRCIFLLSFKSPNSNRLKVDSSKFHA
ncbi:unnamed protein product [Allacma fusca]|uniref:Uncharacterized protein n=1 Tax=Allacma fusca TaxID=39272 RepID=A0A8J2NTL3_9HEXA|nr:unnamed protein product [Allacma fusca]